MLRFLAEKVRLCIEYRGLLGHLNSNGDTTLHHFVLVGTYEAYIELVETKDLFLEKELSAEAKSGVNPVLLCILSDRVGFLRYFLSLCHDRTYHELVKYALRKQAARRDVVALVAHSGAIPEHKRAEYKALLLEFRGGRFPPPPDWLSAALGDAVTRAYVGPVVRDYSGDVIPAAARPSDAEERILRRDAFIGAYFSQGRRGRPGLVPAPLAQPVLTAKYQPQQWEALLKARNGAGLKFSANVIDLDQDGTDQHIGPDDVMTDGLDEQHSVDWSDSAIRPGGQLAPPEGMGADNIDI